MICPVGVLEIVQGGSVLKSHRVYEDYKHPDQFITIFTGLEKLAKINFATN